MACGWFARIVTLNWRLPVFRSTSLSFWRLYDCRPYKTRILGLCRLHGFSFARSNSERFLAVSALCQALQLGHGTGH